MIKLNRVLICFFCFNIISNFGFSQSKNDWENPSIFQINQVLPHTNLMPFNTVKEAFGKDKKSSPNFLTLNGDWDFNFSENLDEAPSDFYKDNFNRKKWDKIKVPSNWEMEGFGYAMFRNIGQPYNSKPPLVPKEFNPIGSYYRTFTLPKNWKEKQHFLHFEGVQSASYVWINGVKVGYNQGAMEPAEYDITPYLKNGTNSIAVKVLHYSDGSYLEDQDTWRLAGIFRDVYIMSTPKTHIHDFYVTTELDKNYADATLNIETYIAQFDEDKSHDYVIHASLYDDKKRHIASENLTKVEENQLTGEFDKVSGSFPVNNPKKWSAEHPNLYTLILELRDANNKIIEVFRHNVGFRKVEVKNKAIYVNGMPVKLNAVNSHMMHPKTGHAMDVETMRKDLILMKQFNINCVRTSHYPPNVEYLDLADELGMYIIDEVGDEAHSNIHLSSQPEWRAQYLDRMQKMVYRDRNHASIVIWSAGNESGPGDNICAIIAEGKKIDPSRPAWMYGGNSDENPKTNPIKCEDIVGPRYVTPFTLTKRFALGDDARPSFMDEYLSAAGNSLGGLDEYWEAIYKYPRLTGGAVWDWVSPGIDARWRTTPDASPNKVMTSLMNKALLKEGKFGNALYLSGHDDWLEVYRDTALDISDDQLTLSFWVKPEKYNGDAYFITKGNYQYGIVQSSDTKIQFYIHTDMKVTLEASLPEDWVGKWHQVSGTYDGQNLRLYINGKQVASKTCTGDIINGPYAVNVGKSAEIIDNHLGYLTHTTIDNVRIFNKVIAIEDLTANSDSLKKNAALWLDFESVNDESHYYSLGLPGRTYGLVWPDRTVQPELWQLKKSPQPVAVEVVNLEKGQIEVFNRFSFTNLKALKANWSLSANGEKIESGTLKIDLEPLTKKGLNIPYKTKDFKEATHYVLELSFSISEDVVWAKKGHEVAWEQFEFPFIEKKPETVSVDGISIEDNAENIVFKGSNFTYTFNKEKGLLTSMVYEEKEYLKQGPKFNIWRAPLANELDAWGTFTTSIGHQKDGMAKDMSNGWYALGLNNLEHEVETIQIVKNKERVGLKVVTLATTNHVNNAATGFLNTFNYTISKDGEIRVQTKSSAEGEFTHWIPKIGLQLQIPETFQNIKWYGRGPYETYPDRKTGAKFGSYETTVKSDYIPYIIPQDYGNKTDVYWTSISDDNGVGLLIKGDQTFNTSAQLYDTDNMTRAYYKNQLQSVDYVTLNLDHKMSGVGGTAISILNKYRVLPQAYEFTFYIKPFKK
ncbi:glycoside hydrolase family 2 TIM barrel-domain containing protein [Tamlana sp. 2_MG-2023]|uniref:glycoside hydrolase family 2 TIM barrel-domain containing protein n=1 Tax=unclassified Tamlana TaxID=2614803 RepID=UPI0026E317D4|nr:MULTISPECIES: glycoside hydrolase family 2 TIM barrel-domain containing protein [unclassified Tamlana]MDO6759988.1 glycoside hydrolase family 2 TIM barrel-domain containing protein [Tamlana sp. 2_MG-2023]MDO6791842.1 glycoside hydrolase family 2 TIM barrel-domain containing protein [Tamlana sp. 1_MG-2023]